MEPLKTTEEIAEYLRVEVVTVRRLATRGELPAYRVGGEFRFFTQEIQDYVKGQRVSGSSDPFDKFTERSRKVLSFAKQEAEELGHSYVGTEHLLLGIVREGEGVAATVLMRAGNSLKDVRQYTMDVIELLKQPAEGPGAQIKTAVQTLVSAASSPNPAAEMGLTARSKKVIELAVEEARRMSHRYIGTEHLLLGLLREGDGPAAGVLIDKCGLKLEMARELVLQILKETSTMTLPEIPEQAATLLGENEQGVTCGRCGAHNPDYFRYCFHCGLKLP